MKPKQLERIQKLLDKALKSIGMANELIEKSKQSSNPEIPAKKKKGKGKKI